MVASDILIACTIEALDARNTCNGKDIRRIDDFDVSEQVDNPIAVAADNPIAVRRANIELLLLEKLIDDVNLPKKLREMNVPEKDLPMLAADVMLQQRLLVNNPREVTEADALAIYQDVY